MSPQILGRRKLGELMIMLVKWFVALDTRSSLRHMLVTYAGTTVSQNVETP
jgi:hypothetical protein